MAKKRDVAIAIIIIASFVVVLMFFGLLMIGTMSYGELEFAGLGGGAVGVVEMFGIMTEESGRPVVKLLDKWKDNKAIEAIVLHVNSGGGEVAISQEIYNAILRAREEKPVVLAMAAVAASGGYYIACAADRIIANPGTVTGSIGVIISYHRNRQIRRIQRHRFVQQGNDKERGVDASLRCDGHLRAVCGGCG